MFDVCAAYVAASVEYEGLVSVVAVVFGVVAARVTHGCSFVNPMRSVIAGFAFVVASFELPVAFCVFLRAVAWAADGAWFVMSNRISHNLRRFLYGFVGMMSAPSSVSASKCSFEW